MAGAQMTGPGFSVFTFDWLGVKIKAQLPSGWLKVLWGSGDVSGHINSFGTLDAKKFPPAWDTGTGTILGRLKGSAAEL